MRIGAALFNGDHGRLRDEVQRLDHAGVDFVHFDVFDGHLVADLGFPPRTIATLRTESDLPFEVHLGALHPERFAPALAEAGADRVIFHVEGAPMLYETIFAFHELGIEVGIALGLMTPVEVVEAAALSVEAVLLLSRVTGEGTRGATYNAAVEPRVEKVREMMAAAGSPAEIQVAGGVRREHIPGLVSRGVGAIAFGSGLYQADDMAAEVEALRNIARGAENG